MPAMPYHKLGFHAKLQYLVLGSGPHVTVCNVATGAVVASTQLNTANATRAQAPIKVLACPFVQPRIPLSAAKGLIQSARAVSAQSTVPSATQALHALTDAEATKVKPLADPVPTASAGAVETSVQPESQTTETLIRDVAFTPNGKYLAVCRDDKALYLWDTATWTLALAFSTLRRANRILFTHDGQSLLVADKFGDVYRYQLDDYLARTQTAGTSVLNALGDDDDLVLGHVSMLLDLALSPDDKFILTADRDEKIRVSHYPNGYNIQAFGLAHTAFVSSLALPPTNTDARVLISGGGDGLLVVWDYYQGQPQQLWQLPTLLSKLNLTCATSLPNVRRIVCLSGSDRVAVICETVPAVLMFQLHTTTVSHYQLRFDQAIPTCMAPLDLVADTDHRLWLSGMPAHAMPTHAPDTTMQLECLVPDANQQYHSACCSAAAAWPEVNAILTLPSSTLATCPKLPLLEELRKDPKANSNALPDVE
ncbi:WD repeat-containing protein 4 [Dimargaris verticillata]|uniref:WD repeat-containing protein 4 n=1 Tax=Dimargaris verticillata TaxID=2761393 RepID=A0A9W8E9R9_9FUNG|nr:WD repeat-containing protein 4 [Dimargaris verticillata]